MAVPEDNLRAAGVLEELRSERNLMSGVIPDQYAQTPNRTRFAFGSCQYPGGFADQVVAYGSYRDLVQRIEASDNRPRFVVLTGDQVYTDATAGVLDPSIRDGRYVLPYNRWLRAHSVRSVLRQIPSFMIGDDHEIENDWEGPDNGTPFAEAIRAYKKYQRSDDPPESQLYFDFAFDGFRFFMLDTRTRRTIRDMNNLDTASIIDRPPPIPQPPTNPQLDAIVNWLAAAPADQPLFIVSPSMLLPRHRDAARWDHAASVLHSDGWDGYPASLHQLLVMAAKSSAEHIVFLSGDEHAGCLATATIRYEEGGVEHEKTIHSIHTPGLFTPYSFANSNPVQWLAETNRTFTLGGTDFEYTVTYTPFAGEGFAYVDVEKDAGGWHLKCQFADETPITVF